MNQEFDTPQDALAHHGVKGMKWGIRRAASGVGKAGAALNTARKENDQEIRDARAALPAKRQALKAAKKQYKTDRKVVGRREARKALKPVRKEFYANLSRAMDETSSEALTNRVDAHYNAKFFDMSQRRSFSTIVNDEISRNAMNTTIKSILD